MENGTRVGSGDVDSQGDIVTAEEGARWAREAISRLPRDAKAMPRDAKVEYSKYLVEENERWLDQLKHSRAAA
jgi:hypothetical protein